MSPRPWRAVLAAVLTAGALMRPSPLPAQQGPRLREPRGFDFTPDGVWRRRARSIAAQRNAALARGDLNALNAAMRSAPFLLAPGASANAMALTGVLRVPIFLVRFKNTNAASLPSPASFNTLLLGSPATTWPYSLRTYYEEISNGLFSVQGEVIGWTALDSNDSWYEGPCNGLCYGPGTSYGHVADLMAEIVAKNDTLDFGRFDNDGPDGIPNSGDDDGFVDVMVIIQPELDGACQGLTANPNLWSHRFSHSAWTGSPLVTNDASSHAGFTTELADNYILQSAVGGGQTGCNANQIMAVGTTAHELGHALGLPDFYDTTLLTEGIGEWGLMSSGNYKRPYSPAYMEGYSRLQLGWVTVRDITTTGTYALGPYAVADTIMRITPTGPNTRNEYFLLENRQAVLSDSALINAAGPGLLIFHVDPVQYAAWLSANKVNTGAIHALALEQADGRGDLDALVNRSDAGDPYPGSSGNHVYGPNSTPALVLNDGTVPPFVVDSIYQVTPQGAVTFRFRTGAFTAIRASDTTAVIRVRGLPFSVYRDIYADGDTVTVSTDSAQVAPDERTEFEFVSWSDGGARTHVATMSSAGGTLSAQMTRRFKLVYTASGSGTVTASPAVAQGTFLPEGDSVTLTAQPDPGAAFVGWLGDTTSTSPTIKLRMTHAFLVAASFQSALAVADTALRTPVMGAAYQDTLRLSGGTGTYTFQLRSGTLPKGLQLTGGGVLLGTPTQDSTWTFTVRALSGAQLLDLTLTMTVTAPTLALTSVVSQLVSGGSHLSAAEIRYLDLVGNNNNQFDVGDFVAWLDRTGTVASAEVMRQVVARGRP